jgi:hypothetical protein
MGKDIIRAITCIYNPLKYHQMWMKINDNLELLIKVNPQIRRISKAFYTAATTGRDF